MARAFVDDIEKGRKAMEIGELGTLARFLSDAAHEQAHQMDSSDPAFNFAAGTGTALEMMSARLYRFGEWLDDGFTTEQPDRTPEEIERAKAAHERSQRAGNLWRQSMELVHSGNGKADGFLEELGALVQNYQEEAGA